MAQISFNEADRLNALKRYRILNTAPEEALDDLAKLAARICGVPIALINLIDLDRQWFKSKVGWDAVDVPRDIGFCEHTILQHDEVLVISDTLSDVRFASDPLVTAHPNVRFYAGAPLVTPEGYAIGTLCTMDSVPRTLSADQLDTLRILSRQVITQLELKANVTQLERTVNRQKRVENALQRSNQRFHQTLDELQQTQTQLIQTEKMSSLGQMVAGVAHEINNPVSFVYGNLTYVNRYIQDLFTLLNLYQRHYPQPAPEIQQWSDQIDLNFLSEDLPKILASMKVGADRIRQIILSLRNFSRLDEAEKKAVDLHQGIDNTLLILQHRLKPAVDHPGIEVIKTYGNIPLVECYAGQLNQVFMNILSNAVDALEQIASNSSTSENMSAKGRISISTRFTNRGKFSKLPCVVIRIVDNGSGIPSAVKEKLFDPFFTTKPVGKGTGLGLSISYQIVVERHGGILKCFSEPGQGTEFWIEIPTCDVPSGSFETYSLPASIRLEAEENLTAKSDSKAVTYQDAPFS
ncbi:MAG: GAF domain-containing sensor histidine kinase [Leptolyngbyaceae cyanobacterium SM1_4_3]|nr:GAF domain-containing sensor histidine kinase [Leptolyngbyaceae cyanobacterium SM1_4_3]